MDATAEERELERLLAAAARDPAQRPAFSAALLARDVYVLGTIEGDVVDGVVQTGGVMQLLAVEDGDGPLTPFFTSERAVRRFLDARPGTDPRFLRIGCRSLFETTSGARLALNLHSDDAKLFLPAEVDALAQGREPGLETEVLAAGQQVLVGAAAEVPPELPAVLARFLTQRPVVDAAHLGWIAHPDGRAGFLMLVVASDREQAMAGFGSVAIGDVTGGGTLDVVVVPPGSDDPLAAALPRFYTRQPQADVPA